MTRLFHRIYAAVGGYFWLPCPICGEKFGGHEWAGSVSGAGVCPRCAPGARILDQLIMQRTLRAQDVVPLLNSGVRLSRPMRSSVEDR